MLRGTEKWVTYFVLAIVFILGIFFLTKQIGLTLDLKQSLIQAKQAGIFSGDLRKITTLHNASSKVFFLSFFSFCLLIIGIIIVIRGIHRAYDISEVKEKVRHHLKSTTPGIVMIVLASFLLAFCSYRTSYIETVYSSRLIDYNNFKIAMRGWDKTPGIPETLNVDSLALSRLRKGGANKTPATGIQQGKAGKGAERTAAVKPAETKQKAPVSQQKNERTITTGTKSQPGAVAKKPEAGRTKAPEKNPKAIAGTRKAPTGDTKAGSKPAGKPSLVKKAAAAKKDGTRDPGEQSAGKTEAAALAGKTTRNKKAGAVTGKHRSAKQPAIAGKGKQARVVYSETPVSRQDVVWANQFQRNVTIYGYEPSRAEKEKYNRVRAWAEQMNGGMMNPELQWAYSFLEKTRKGYEPKPGEMRQYEQVIERNLNARNGTGSSEGI